MHGGPNSKNVGAISKKIRKKKLKRKENKATGPNPCHKWIRIILDASEALD